MQSTLKNSKNIVSKILSNGGIAILPTDTIYSLSCITSNTNSLKKILKETGNVGILIILGSGIVYTLIYLAERN